MKQTIYLILAAISVNLFLLPSANAKVKHKHKHQHQVVRAQARRHHTPNHTRARTHRASTPKSTKQARGGSCKVPVAQFAGQNCKHPGTEEQCMVCNTFFEAGILGDIGQLAVGANVMTRVASHAYPNSVCNVVHQGQYNPFGSQYSWTQNRRTVLPRSGPDLCKAVENGLAALKKGPFLPVKNRKIVATHYLAHWMPKWQRPSWAKTCPMVANDLDGHDFFFCPGIITQSEIAAAAPKEEAPAPAIATVIPVPTPRPEPPAPQEASLVLPVEPQPVGSSDFFTMEEDSAAR